MAAENPNNFDDYRAGEPPRSIKGSSDPNGFDHFRAGEPTLSVIAATATQWRTLMGVGV